MFLFLFVGNFLARQHMKSKNDCFACFCLWHCIFFFFCVKHPLVWQTWNKKWWFSACFCDSNSSPIAPQRRMQEGVSVPTSLSEGEGPDPLRHCGILTQKQIPELELPDSRMIHPSGAEVNPKETIRLARLCKSEMTFLLCRLPLKTCDLSFSNFCCWGSGALFQGQPILIFCSDESGFWSSSDWIRMDATRTCRDRLRWRLYRCL